MACLRRAPGATGSRVADEARFRFSTIAHAGRALLGPLSAESVEALLARIDLQPPGGGPDQIAEPALDIHVNVLERALEIERSVADL